MLHPEKEFKPKASLLNQLFPNEKISENLIASFNNLITFLVPVTGLGIQEITEQVQDLLLCKKKKLTISKLFFTTKQVETLCIFKNF